MERSNAIRSCVYAIVQSGGSKRREESGRRSHRAMLGAERLSIGLAILQGWHV